MSLKSDDCAKPVDGAVFMRLGDVPVDWEVRNWEDSREWRPEDGDDPLSDYADTDAVVEARPRPEPPVTVTVPRSVAQSIASQTASPIEFDVVGAFRDALKAAES